MNFQIALIAVMFSLMKEFYFGWNFTPKSDAEIVCDGIGLLIVALSIFASSIEKRNKLVVLSISASSVEKRNKP